MAQTPGIHLFDFDSIGNESCLAFFEMQDGYFLCNDAIPVGQYAYYNLMKYDSTLTNQQFVNKQIYGFPQDGIEMSNGNIVIKGTVIYDNKPTATWLQLYPNGETLQLFYDLSSQVPISQFRIYKDTEDNIYHLQWGLCPDSLQSNGFCFELIKLDSTLTPVWRHFANEDTVYNQAEFGRFILQDNGDLVVAIIKDVQQFFQYETVSVSGCALSAGPQARSGALDVIKYDNDGNELFRKTIYDDSPFGGAAYLNILDKGNGNFMVFYQKDTMGAHIHITKHFNNLGEVDSTKHFFSLGIHCVNDNYWAWDQELLNETADADAVSKNGYEGVHLVRKGGGANTGTYTMLHYNSDGDLLCRKYVLFGDYINEDNEIDLTLHDNMYSMNIVVMRGIKMLTDNRYALYGSIDTTNYIWLDDPNNTGWFQYTVDRNPFVFIDTLGCANENKFDTLIFLDNPEIALPDGTTIQVAISPNPAYDMVQLKLSKPIPFDAAFSLIDQTGKSLLTQNLSKGNSGLNAIDIRHLPQGYMVWHLVSLDQKYKASGWLLKASD
jgi:hypothetical protein